MDDEQKQPAESTENSESKCEEYLAGWKRALADYDNLKKDLAKERTEASKYAKVNLIMELLPVLDNFDLAIKFAPPDPENTDGFLKGVRSIRMQLESVLVKMGVVPYGNPGDLFDPNEHESIGKREDPNAAPNSVVEVAQRGWKFDGFVIRPAKVIVNS